MSDLTSDRKKEIYKKLISDLSFLLKECSQPNWDGYNAVPLSLSSITASIVFIEELMPFLYDGQGPLLSASPDGDVNFDWIYGRDRMISMQIESLDKCIFVSIIGSNKLRGTVDHFSFIHFVLPALINMIKNIEKDAKA